MWACKVVTTVRYRNMIAVMPYKIGEAGCLTYQQKTWESHCKIVQFFPEFICQ